MYGATKLKAGDYVPPDHPYVQTLDVVVWKMGNGRWTCRWRSFDTIKQDCEFATEAEARRCADRLRIGPHKLHEDMLQEDIDLADNWWREFAKRGQK